MAALHTSRLPYSTNQQIPPTPPTHIVEKKNDCPNPNPNPRLPYSANQPTNSTPINPPKKQVADALKPFQPKRLRARGRPRSLKEVVAHWRNKVRYW